LCVVFADADMLQCSAQKEGRETLFGEATLYLYMLSEEEANH
jgi:hypothetical protein